MHLLPIRYLLISAAFLFPAQASAQDLSDGEPRRVRVALGPQLVPSYPGSDDLVLRPLFDIARARGDAEFAFEAPDESFGFTLVRTGNLTFGPSLGLEGKRKSSEVGGTLPDVGFTVEVGAFAQYAVSENIRLRAEARQGLGGHDGFISVLSADYVLRDGDRQLLSVGPRLKLTDSNYQDSYFGIRPEDASPGLPAYDADGGVQSAGVAAGYIRQFTPRWGIYSYVKYDRLLADPADSPVVRQFGSRDQIAGGAALTYTFGSGVR